MKIALILAVSLVITASAQAADKPKKVPVALERKLHGIWEGGPCVGKLTFRADGTYDRQHFSPGNNKVSGTWEVLWNALPPTLVLTRKTSDAPDRLKVGYISEVKLIQLNNVAFTYEYRDRKVPYRRLKN